MAVDLVFIANSSIFDIFLLESISFLEKLEPSEVFSFTERASGKAGISNRNGNGNRNRKGNRNSNVKGNRY